MSSDATTPGGEFPLRFHGRSMCLKWRHTPLAWRAHVQQGCFREFQSLPYGQVFRHKGDKVWKAANIGKMGLKGAKWDAVCPDLWRKPKVHQAHLHAWQLAKLAHQVAVLGKKTYDNLSRAKASVVCQELTVFGTEVMLGAVGGPQHPLDESSHFETC